MFGIGESGGNASNSKLKWGVIIGAIIGLLTGGIAGMIKGALLGAGIGAVADEFTGGSSLLEGLFGGIKKMLGFGGKTPEQGQEPPSHSQGQSFDYNSLTANVPPGMGKGQQR